jgi:hypothetical protein
MRLSPKLDFQPETAPRMTPSSTLADLLSAVAAFCRRRALLVVLAGVLLGALGALAAAARLGVTTDTAALFDADLPWRQHEIAFERAFPQFSNLVVAVVEGATPEEAEATAAALAARLAADTAHFTFARRPDADPFLQRHALLYLDEPDLTALLDQTIDAQPFLGQLASDPSARGLFATLALVAMGVERGESLDGFRPALDTFARALAEAAAGAPAPLSWQRLLAGPLADLAGPRRLVLAQAKLDLGALEPGGQAIAALREAAATLEHVAAGRASVRATGSVALADEEFATVAEGAAAGVAVSAALVLLWLVLAVRSWRLILPIAATLALGLVLTTGFAALAVGALNLISVAFAVLFVGMAVDFAIQFCVRYRENRLASGDEARALRATMQTAGPQIVLAALATAAGFLAFVPTDFRGVAELGLIAGVGMLIALACSLTFLPALLVLMRPRGEAVEVGYRWAARAEARLVRVRLPVAAGFAALCLAGALLAPRIAFDSDPLNTKDPASESMQTLRALINEPLTSPYTADILVDSPDVAASLLPKLRALPLVADAISLPALVPDNQAAKLELIADASGILAATLAPRSAAAPVTPSDLRLAIATARTEIERVAQRLPPDDPLRAIATALAALATVPDAALMETNMALTRFLPDQLDRLRRALEVGPVALADIPPALARDWRLPDGRIRVRVSAKPEARDAAGLHEFVAQVRTVAPAAGGSAVGIVESADTIVGAFRTAALGALGAITVLLLVLVRRPLDVALVIGALVASALLTVPVIVLLPLPLNFANIIALPLLLGVGVSFNIYFVMNWRAGDRRFLGTATARAVLFSALTTATAFGTLAASGHPGTASMGALLLWSLGAALLVSLVLLPVLLAARRPAAGVALVALLLAGLPLPTVADTLAPPEGAVQGGPAARALWRFEAPATGTGTLALEWTDTLGRTVERRTMPLDMRDAREIAIPLDMRRAAAMDNRLAATLALNGQPPRRLEAGFTARPPAPGWTDWVAIYWQDADAAGRRTLAALGVAAGKVQASRDEPYDRARVEAGMAPLRATNRRWYVENIATDFYSSYHRWHPDRPVTWLFDEAKRRRRENPADPTVNIREPGLSDPAWIARIQARLHGAVRHHGPHRPLFYNLGDEPGIADLAANWDFDFAPESLEGFRAWLRTEYRDLAALNRQWGSDFAAWDAVVPPTTDAAMARADRNWSGWADFKTWMDIAFARALRAGTDAVHQADPTALAGIAGAQVPGWGGYDYGRLVGALDLIEIYNAGNNVEIVRSLRPDLVLLTTSFSTGPAEAGRLWREALRGGRGAVLWDSSGTILAPDGTAGPRGLALAPTFHELASGIGAQLIAAAPHHDAVAILYSQASFRTQWMEAVLPLGAAWAERTSENEWHFTPPHRAARARAARLLSALGAQPRWITSELLAGGMLRRAGIRLLVLPETSALSDAEAAEIRAFAARGGTVLAMGPAGLYDGRSRRLARPQLADLAPARAIAQLPDNDDAALPALATLLARTRAQPVLRVSSPGGGPAAGVETRLLQNGEVWLAGLQRGAEAGPEGLTEVVLTVPPGHIATDLRRGARIATPGGRLELRLSGQEPVLLALSPRPQPPPVLAAPAPARVGEVAELRLALAARSPAEASVLRIDVAGPDGRRVAAYSGTVVLRRAPVAWRLPLAASDAPGLWQIRATDILSGAETRLALPVSP